MNSIRIILEECGWIYNSEGFWRCGEFKIAEENLNNAERNGRSGKLRENIIKKLSNTTNPNLLATLERLKVRNIQRDDS